MKLRPSLSLRYDEFVPLVRALHAHVAAHMVDLRSQLARAASHAATQPASSAPSGPAAIPT